MTDLILIIFGLIAVIGGLATAINKDPFDKLISLGILAGGAIPFIVNRGYMDVAIAVALTVPVTTIFILLICRREIT
ncbi:MAG: EhaD family protein [Euryarchaeota archaeon]|nr:EhaD family protein [Methanogenium sp.]MEA2035688.1 EhaD family protein [Euryarchaeota archaeon]